MSATISKLQKQQDCPFNSGTLELHDTFFDQQQADILMQQLIAENHWNHGEYVIAGRCFIMPRWQTWYADLCIIYNFSYELHQRRDWTPELLMLKQQVEHQCQHKFNSVLVNYYRNGKDWVDWHSDDDVELGQAPVIASVSFGINRKFCYRHKNSGNMNFIDLKNGSLLIMKPSFQQYWQHSITRAPEINLPRINLTFRQVVMPG